MIWAAFLALDCGDILELTWHKIVFIHEPTSIWTPNEMLGAAMIILIKVVPGVQSLKQKAHTVVDSKHHVCFSLM